MLTHQELGALIEALRPSVVGAQVQKIRQPDPLTLVLRARAPGKTTHLVLSAHPRAPRIAAAEAQGGTMSTPTAINTWLRATLMGRRLQDLTLAEDDRVVTLHFEGGRLVCELGTRAPNLYGLDPEGALRVSAGPPRADLSAADPYLAPPPMPAGPPPRPPRWIEPLAVEAEARRRVEAASEADAERARSRLIRRARKRLERLIAKVEREVAQSAEAERYRHWGELLKGQLHLIERGAEAVEVRDWYQEGAPHVRVPLDPKLDAAANLAKLFARYKKAKAGAARSQRRLEEAEEALLKLEIYAEEIEDVEALAARLYAEGIVRERIHVGGGRKRGSQAPRKPYQRFYSASGLRILVGRGGADNHALTFQVARGNDLWLHARDAAGSHVIVPVPRGGEPDREALLDAAALAAHHSKLKGEPLVEVSYTQRKHVRAIKGAGPGRVTIAAASTITVSGVPARIEALYQRRRAHDGSGEDCPIR